jgi:NTP pyrophosphatase (non-canonical NTP hydrolase)
MRSFDELVELMARLRAPDGCPWDRKQDHRSLRTHLLEETYEVLDALDAGEDESLQDELGDLLLQVLFHAQIAREEGRFPGPLGSPQGGRAGGGRQCLAGGKLASEWDPSHAPGPAGGRGNDPTGRAGGL